MVRSQRLLALVDLLRRHRYPVSGQQLAETLNISLRTLYRDIASLQQQGANIQGEAGVGYVLKPGFLLPPLMFTEEEIEALVLGTRWVAERTDSELSEGARSALTKVATVLPQALKEQLENSSLLIGPSRYKESLQVDMPELRRAIRDEKVLLIHYCDQHDQATERRIWPFALGYFDDVRVLVAWCELRQAIRHFRTDRIQSSEVQEERYKTPRYLLLTQWRASLTTTDIN